jgi:hypothetical protein
MSVLLLNHHSRWEQQLATLPDGPVLATSSIRSEADRTMWLVRTSFLRHIANDESNEV